MENRFVDWKWIELVPALIVIYTYFSDSSDGTSGSACRHLDVLLIKL
jgi:hypothetical protein